MRIEKINELIKQELSKVLLENIEFEPGILVTITNVETSEDVKHAKVWVSVFPENRAGEILRILNQAIGSIQGILNRKLVLKFVPRISFEIDKSASYAANIEKVFKEIEEEKNIDN